jgi:hypothetical protein
MVGHGLRFWPQSERAGCLRGASAKLRGFAGVAQLVEQRIRNAKVTSSIPVTGTKRF